MESLKFCQAISILLLFLGVKSFGQEKLQLNHDCKVVKSPYSSVYVIDNRKEGQLLGYIQKGAFNHTKEIVFDGQITDSLSQFFTTSSTVTQTNPLVIILNEMFLREISKEVSEIGRFKLSMRFFAQTTENQFTEFYTLDSTYSVRGMDVTKRLLNSPSEQFCLISEHIAGMKITKTSNQSYTLEELRHLDSLEKLTIPIYTTTQPRPGIYKDYSHFKMNTPDIQTDILIEQTKSNKIKVYRFYGAKKRKVALDTEGIYAVSDGNLLLKASSEGYYQIRKIGSDLIYDRPATFYKTYGGAPFVMVFGVTGAVIASSLTNSGSTYRFMINHRRGNSIPVAVVD